MKAQRAGGKPCLARFHDWLVTLAVLLLLTFGLAAPARAANHIQASLVAESAPAPGGTTALAVRFVPADGWHGYWRNPGDAGLGARFEWRLPDGVTMSPLRYPVPQKLVISGLMNHVYKGEHVLLGQLRLPAGAKPGTRLSIRAKADWLACTDTICVPESGELATDIIVGTGAAQPGQQSRFDRWRKALPQPLGTPGAFAITDGKVRIGIPLPASVAIADPWYFSGDDSVIAYARPQRAYRNGEMLVIEAELADSSAKPNRLEGVLSIGEGRGFEVEATPGAVASDGEPVSGLARTGGWVVLLAFGGAVLGGLLLNIMPCVFPILSLKALSLARAGESEGEARREGLAYTAGTVLACLALGGILLGLRAGGASVGWAFQLQDPRIVGMLFLLMLAITLNLAGRFELPGPGGASPKGAFSTGALAAFVATPCSGPFMASALGAALVLPTGAALAVFAGLGLGIALPFLLIGYLPSLRSRLPKPGAWMARFRLILAVPMALTALALGWLIWRQAGMAGLVVLLVTGVGLAALLDGIGRFQRRGRAAPALAVGIALLSMVAVPLVSLPPKAKRNTLVAGALNAIPFDAQRLATLRQLGRPVFLYFTADWCVSCKVNEKAAIDRDSTAAHFKASGITVMVGDWTNGDATISRFLESQGRSGVPLYLFYPKGGEPVVLPQVLTPSMLGAL